MRESDTYQAILDEGREEGRINATRKLILRLGQKRFGVPGEKVATTLATLTDLERLEFLHDHLLDVQSWEELMALP